MDRVIGRVTVLSGESNGKYPHGNSLLVRGQEERIVIDPSLSLYGRTELPGADRVLCSHCHEDHVAGVALYPDAPVHLHEADALGLRAEAGLTQVYGYAPETAAAFGKILRDKYHYVPRPDAIAFADGACFDLGGARIRVVHAPGHTRGHCLFHIEPDDVLYLGDIDLSSFGPYYGDAWSSLEDFERTLARVREIDARHYATFHHVGVLDGREAFLERLDRFCAVIAKRHAQLLAFLSEPRTLGDIVLHRFIYPPSAPAVFVNDVERRSMGQHLMRLVAEGAVREVEPGLYTAR